MKRPGVLIGVLLVVLLLCVGLVYLDQTGALGNIVSGSSGPSNSSSPTTNDPYKGLK
ncbi:hypothetical protein [Deinococcus psychrotolerans]|uniref:hypothetical protein n=1 Tax=Deinococcus psychrotolerans TaxID=2489213 RepID=UPI0013DD91DD|nr:hypothetical protein [Deinococcus psychrotolerans]